MSRFPGAVLFGAAAGAAVVFVLMTVRAGPDLNLPDARDIRVLPKITETEAETLRESRYASIDSVQEVMSLPTAFSRAEAMYALAGRADAGQVQALLFDALRIADDAERDDALHVLFRRLVDLDPRTAVALSRLDEIPGRRRFERSVWRLWSRSDFESALDAASEIGDPKLRNAAAQALFAENGFMNTPNVDRIETTLGTRPDRQNRSRYLLELFERSPAEAFAYLNSLPMGIESREAFGSIAGYLADVDTDDIALYANMIADRNQRELFKQWHGALRSQNNPEASLRTLLASPKRENRTQIFSAMQALAALDIDTAKRIFEETTSPDLRSMMAMGLAQAYASQDPEAAIAWARENGGDSRSRMGQDLQAIVLGQVARSNPDLALDELRSMPMSRRRDQIQQQVLLQIVDADPERALDVLDEFTFTVENRNSSRQMLVSVWASKDPGSASNWILANRDSMSPQELAGVGRAIVNADLDTAMRMLPRITGPAARSWRNSIAQQLVNTDSFDDAQNFIQQFRGDDDYPVLQSQLVSRLARTDPARAEQMARQLPAGAARDSLLQSMIATLSMQAPQKAEQLLDLVVDDNAKNNAVSNLIQYKVRQDPAAASRWVLSRPTGQQKDHAIMALLNSGGGSIADVDRLLDALSDQSMRARAETTYIMMLTYRDSSAARQALERSKLPKARKDELAQRISAQEERGMLGEGSMYIPDY